jgi:hypothetical protein
MSHKSPRARFLDLLDRALTPKPGAGHACGPHAFRCQICQALHAMHVLSGDSRKCHMCCDD